VAPAILDAARMHAAVNSVEIDYRLADAARLSEKGGWFDAVIDTAIFGHTSDLKAAVEANSRLVTPGGIIVIAARNRTVKSRALAAIGASQVSAIVPSVDQAPIQYVTPERLRQEFAQYGVTVKKVVGISYHPWFATFRLSAGCSAGYFAVAVRPRKPTLTVIG